MKIQVGEITWTVVEDQYMEDDLFGQTTYLGAVVRMNPRQNQDQARETLLHELLHVLAFSAGVELGTMEEEEKIVKVLSPALLSVLCDNPELIRVLVGDGAVSIMGEGKNV